jgi:hypothetical protein
MLSYSVSALRRLRPQGWQSQTPVVGQPQTSRLSVSAQSVTGGEEGISCAWVAGAGPTREDRGTREHALQIRLWRWVRSIGAGGLIVQFYNVSNPHEVVMCQRQNSLCTQPFHISCIHLPCLWHSLQLSQSLTLGLPFPIPRNTSLRPWLGSERYVRDRVPHPRSRSGGLR